MAPRKPKARATRRTSGKVMEKAPQVEKARGWTFLTNHSHVLIALYRNPGIVLREVAQQVGITERAVQRIVHDLEDDGFVVRERVGRQNEYQVSTDLTLRHPIESHRTVGDLLEMVSE